MDCSTMQCRVGVLCSAHKDMRLPASSVSRAKFSAIFVVCIDVDFLLPLRNGAWQCLITYNVMVTVRARAV